MRLIELQPARDNDRLVGWTARFTDESGKVRIATVGLGCLLDPSAFTQAVTQQGIRYTTPHPTNPTAWKALLRQLTVFPSRKAG